MSICKCGACVVYVCVAYALPGGAVHEASGGYQVSCPTTFFCIPSKQGLSLKPKLVWRPTSSSYLPVSGLSSTGILDVYSSTCLFTWVLRIQSWGLLFAQQALFPADTISNVERCTTTPSLCRARNQTQGFSKLGKHSSSWKMPPAHREDFYKGLEKFVMNIELTSTDQVEMILMGLLLIIWVDSYRRVTLMPTLLANTCSDEVQSSAMTSVKPSLFLKAATIELAFLISSAMPRTRIWLWELLTFLSLILVSLPLLGC